MRPALGCTSRGSREKALELLGCEDFQEGLNQCGLPDARTSRDDDGPASQRYPEGIVLARGEFAPGLLFDPGDRLLRVDGRIGFLGF